MIKSEFSIFNISLLVIIFIFYLFLFSFALFSGSCFTAELSHNALFLLLLFGELLVGFDLLFIINNLVVYTLDKDGVRVKLIFRREVYIQWSEISQVDLNDSKQRYLWMYPDYSITIYTANNKYVLWDRHYRNIDKIKLFIKKCYFQKRPDEKDALYFTIHGIQRNFHGSLISFKMLFTFGFWTVLYFGFISAPHHFLDYLILTVIFEIVIFRFGYDTNYLVIKNDSIIIRNYIWFWVHKIFAIDEIEEIILKPKVPNYRGIRIIGKDSKSHYFPLDLLGNKNILEFQTFMKRGGVKVITK
jgi:hypothetical protein